MKGNEMSKSILIFNGYYLPAKKYGGPTTSVENIVNTCSDQFEFNIVAANHDVGERTIFKNISEGWNQVGKAKVLYVDSAKYGYSIKRIEKIIEETQASLVCLAGIFRPEIKWCAITICRRKNIPVILSPRGEVCKSTFAMKKYKKAPFAMLVNAMGIYRGVMFHATSEEERNGLIEYFKIPKENIYLVPNISKQYINRDKPLKIPGKIRVVFISRIQYKKNIAFAIDIVNRMKSDVDFDIYGPMESPDYWDVCKKIISKSPSNVKVKYCGALNPEDVGVKFGEYDCFLFPTLSENYGHVIAESMLNCCPVIISKDTTPWNDLHERAGFVVDLADEKGFVEKLEIIAAMNNDEYGELLKSNREYIIDKIGKDNAVQGHIDMYNNVIERFAK